MSATKTSKRLKKDTSESFNEIQFIEDSFSNFSTRNDLFHLSSCAPLKNATQSRKFVYPQDQFAPIKLVQKNSQSYRLATPSYSTSCQYEIWEQAPQYYLVKNGHTSYSCRIWLPWLYCIIALYPTLQVTSRRVDPSLLINDFIKNNFKETTYKPSQPPGAKSVYRGHHAHHKFHIRFMFLSSERITSHNFSDVHVHAMPFSNFYGNGFQPCYRSLYSEQPKISSGIKDPFVAFGLPIKNANVSEEIQKLALRQNHLNSLMVQPHNGDGYLSYNLAVKNSKPNLDLAQTRIEYAQSVQSSKLLLYPNAYMEHNPTYRYTSAGRSEYVSVRAPMSLQAYYNALSNLSPLEISTFLYNFTTTSAETLINAFIFNSLHAFPNSYRNQMKRYYPDLSSSYSILTSYHSPRHIAQSPSELIYPYSY